MWPESICNLGIPMYIIIILQYTCQTGCAHLILQWSFTSSVMYFVVKVNTVPIHDCTYVVQQINICFPQRVSVCQMCQHGVEMLCWCYGSGMQYHLYSKGRQKMLQYWNKSAGISQAVRVTLSPTELNMGRETSYIPLQHLCTGCCLLSGPH